MAVNKRETLEYFARLARYPEHQPFRDWLAFEIDRYSEQLVLINGADAFRVIQGRAQVLRELQELLDKAESLLDKKPGQ